MTEISLHDDVLGMGCEVLCRLGHCPKDNKERPECPDFTEEAEGVVALLT